MVQPIEQRLLSGAVPEPNSGCWLWTGADNDTGYCQVWYNGKRRYVHRIAWEVWRGAIPDRMSIDHLCNTPRCINPDHLSVATQRENVLRSTTGVSAINARKKTCKRSHALSGDNLLIVNGTRQCRRCRNLRAMLSQRILRSSKLSHTLVSQAAPARQRREDYNQR